MKTYLLSLILASALSAGALYLSSGRKFEKHIRYLAALLVLCVILAPLPSLAKKEIPSLLHLDEAHIPDDASLYDEAIIKAFKDGMREEIVSLIARKCGLAEDDFAVSLDVSCADKKLSVDKVRILLKDFQAIVQREKIRAELDMLCTDIDFIEFSDESEAFV